MPYCLAVRVPTPYQGDFKKQCVSPIDEKTKNIVRNVMAFYVTLQFDKVMLMIENVAP